MHALTANDLKTRGVTAVEEGMEQNEEVLISVRGRDRYVVMVIETYNRLRELELAAAVTEAKADYAAGRYSRDSVEDHIQRISDDL
ncbi:type II toxin-antitoxin system Phd/YefM family antitoxin [Chromatocurvus halotolerans]|uniref:Antitoxin Phd_YefM of type II toxin-antitoxin system n=1 Tax=Chromatocurvus halotolerans TaxID=1132028 RepID=A0A4R2KP25_9GAMM|nr:type II toxin-antitoxin system Phd/YefM family antitoxin [Chromatocurvus halotolerans]TCO74357.1 hypothetical protein EV688_11471 [Chromatocurvus halotolerans]